MQNKPKLVAYRCPECGVATLGHVGRFTQQADLFRIKCTCGASSLDIHAGRSEKLRFSVPCLLCRRSHSYTVSESIVTTAKEFALPCPYARTDILFLGDEERITEALKKAEEELSTIIGSFGGEKLRDIQPEDMDAEEILPDPEVYDIVRFLVRELEADGAIDCPCHSGAYDFRFTDGGVQVYCPDCGGSYTFPAESAQTAREFLSVSTLKLT